MAKILPKKSASLPSVNYSSGQVLIGVLVAFAVFMILAHALFTLISSSSHLVVVNKSRITAKYIAQEKIETIRNMNYEDIGVVDGIPDGLIEPEETIDRNGQLFWVTTSIVYIDDPFDGTGSDDLFPDFKRVRVEVNWEGIASSERSPLVLITDIAANSLVSAAGTGMLSILVLDAYGLPVPQATVSIFADSIIPNVDVDLQTNDSGILLLPGVIPCVECYQITVTKTGYSQDRTYSTSEVDNPSKPHASVIEAQVTQVGFAIDQVGTINISTFSDRDSNFTSQPNVELRLRGSKTIGIDAFLQPVYKYDETVTTDESGTLTLNDLEWDTYTLLMPAVTSYDISGTNPLNPVSLLPSGSVDWIIATSAHTDYSLLTKVKDTSQNQIEDAFIKISSGAFEQELTSGLEDDPDWGQAFYSSLSNSVYDINATASGYLDYSSSHEVFGNDSFTIILNPE